VRGQADGKKKEMALASWTVVGLTASRPVPLLMSVHRVASSDVIADGVRFMDDDKTAAPRSGSKSDGAPSRMGKSGGIEIDCVRTALSAAVLLDGRQRDDKWLSLRIFS